MKFRIASIVFASFALTSQIFASENRTKVLENVSESEIRTAMTNLNGSQVLMQGKPRGMVLGTDENSYTVFDYWSFTGDERSKVIPFSEVEDYSVVRICERPNLVLLQSPQRRDYEILKKSGKEPEITVELQNLGEKCKRLLFKWKV